MPASDDVDVDVPVSIDVTIHVAVDVSVEVAIHTAIHVAVRGPREVAVSRTCEVSIHVRSGGPPAAPKPSASSTAKAAAASTTAAASLRLGPGRRETQPHDQPQRRDRHTSRLKSKYTHCSILQL